MSMPEWMVHKLTEDTLRTLDSVRQLTPATQRSIAASVAKNLVEAVREIGATVGPSSPERDGVMKAQLARAQNARHEALARGASGHSDPGWAAAALVEGWLMSNTGFLDRAASQRIHDEVWGWISSVLSKDELNAL